MRDAHLQQVLMRRALEACLEQARKMRRAVASAGGQVGQLDGLRQVGLDIVADAAHLPGRQTALAACDWPAYTMLTDQPRADGLLDAIGKQAARAVIAGLFQ